jgi:carbon-monoxide dehydrogenase large subunit
MKMGVEGIGARVARKEDKRFLTGKGRYTDDMSVPGMKYAASCAARTRMQDRASMPPAARRCRASSRAERQQMQDDGIGNLICGWMIHSKDGSPMKMGAWRPLAHETVRYVGDAVAVVVADLGEARDAAEAVVVDYEELPAVTDAVSGAARPASRRYIRRRRQSHLRLGDRRWIGDRCGDRCRRPRHRDEIINNRLAPNPMEPRARSASTTRPRITIPATRPARTRMWRGW